MTKAKNNIKKIIVGILLVCFSAFALVGFAGCGSSAPIASLTENFDKLEGVYEDSVDVFESGMIEGLNTDYIIKNNAYIDAKIAASDDSFETLQTVYNISLAISHDYIDTNKTYIINLVQADLTGAAKTALTTLNKSLNSYIETLKQFIQEKAEFELYFKNFLGEEEDEVVLNRLSQYKKAYGELVESNVTLSTHLALAMEETEIYELLKQTEPTVYDTKLAKEMITAKLLPIFTKLRVTEIENELNWSKVKDTTTKSRIDMLVSKLDIVFNKYQDLLANTDENDLKDLSKEQFAELFALVDAFLIETDAYYLALEKFDLEDMALNFDNDLDKYIEKNALANVYLTKIEQFATTSLDLFLTEINSIINKTIQP